MLTSFMLPIAGEEAFISEAPFYPKSAMNSSFVDITALGGIPSREITSAESSKSSLSWDLPNPKSSSSSSSSESDIGKPALPIELPLVPRPENPPFPIINVSDRYEVLTKDVGEGSFGSIDIARDLLGLKVFPGTPKTLMDRSNCYDIENYKSKQESSVAIKTFNRRFDESADEYLDNDEINFILGIPSHTNLMQVYNIFIDSIDYRLHYSMEVMDSDLFKLITTRFEAENPLSSTCIKSILAQVLNGIRHIHDNGWVHCDLKPENILVMTQNDYHGIQSTDPEEHFVAKIADYGNTFHTSEDIIFGEKDGTIWYSAPEMILHVQSRSKPIDMWAFGCIIYEMVTNCEFLFDGNTDKEQVVKISDFLGSPLSSIQKANGITKPLYGYWDEAEELANNNGSKLSTNQATDITTLLPDPELAPLCDVIRECLQWDPSKRGTAASISQMPYFKGTEADHI